MIPDKEFLRPPQFLDKLLKLAPVQKDIAFLNASPLEEPF